MPAAALCMHMRPAHLVASQAQEVVWLVELDATYRLGQLHPAVRTSSSSRNSR
jgi:hypothetical protein